MVIKGEPPTRFFTRSKGIFTVSYRKVDGAIIIRKWPKRRRGDLPLITKRQVTAWDQSQRMVRYAAGAEFAYAYAMTAGTAFYARDTLIMAHYGHLLSWPGYGWHEGG